MSMLIAARVAAARVVVRRVGVGAGTGFATTVFRRDGVTLDERRVEGIVCAK